MELKERISRLQRITLKRPTDSAYLKSIRSGTEFRDIFGSRGQKFKDTFGGANIQQFKKRGKVPVIVKRRERADIESRKFSSPSKLDPRRGTIDPDVKKIKSFRARLQKLGVKLIKDEEIRTLREKIGPEGNFPDDSMKRSISNSQQNFRIQTRGIAFNRLNRLTEKTRRGNPKTPLLKKVPFGKDRRPKVNSIKQTLEQEDLQDANLSLDFSDENNPISRPLNRPQGFLTKVLKKPKRSEFTRIIGAKLEKMAGLKPRIIKKKQPKKIKKIPVKTSQLPKLPITGKELVNRFKNTGLANVNKETGFTFLSDEGRIVDAFKPVDAQLLRNKFATPRTSSLAFISRTTNVQNPDELVGPLENLRTEGKTPLIGGFNSEKTGFEFDATFPMASQTDDEVIAELIKTNQQSALAIDPDLTVRSIPNPKFRITSKTNLQ